MTNFKNIHSNEHSLHNLDGAVNIAFHFPHRGRYLVVTVQVRDGSALCTVSLLWQALQRLRIRHHFKMDLALKRGSNQKRPVQKFVNLNGYF